MTAAPATTHATGPTGPDDATVHHQDLEQQHQDPNPEQHPHRNGGPATSRPAAPRRYWRAGFHRGTIELRHLLRNPKEMTGHLSNIVVALVLAGYIGSKVPGTQVPMAHLMLSGFAAYLLFQVGLFNLPQILVTEREEGALLRLRATPGGIPAYLVAKAVLVVVMALGTLVLLLATAALLVNGPLPHSPAGWLTLLWVSVLGLLAVVPLGAAIGAVLPNPREALALIMLPAMALLVTSGAMFPLASLPVVIQKVASVFPLKWMAQGLRSALLPDAARAAEPAGSWELPTVALVLTAWAVLGFLLAIPLLRRAARRESGSRLGERHRKAALAGTGPA
ncbi:multidrug transporter [Streptomyces sp. NBRC 110611]|uniref:ABC transporter permease n=1 Tax=Streptomyces sp. NBRC 110611 TaxID=1621259 RepID=UPI0008589C9F|nr:ABC transporter permease [Streptomyces sp. NBRC 110611]GAU68577.1 multidrug transporter [Streptomyces sp. NBRC 110611]